MFLWASTGSDSAFGIDPEKRWYGFHFWCGCEGQSLVGEWWKSRPDDQHASGVLADWLEDHRDSLLKGATGPSDPAVRLQQLIDHLRRRFNSQIP